MTFAPTEMSIPVYEAFVQNSHESDKAISIGTFTSWGKAHDAIYEYYEKKRPNGLIDDHRGFILRSGSPEGKLAHQPLRNRSYNEDGTTMQGIPNHSWT